MKKGVLHGSRHGKIGQIKAEKRAFKTRNSSNASTASQPGKEHELDTDNEEEGVGDRGGREKTRGTSEKFPASNKARARPNRVISGTQALILPLPLRLFRTFCTVYRMLAIDRLYGNFSFLDYALRNVFVLIDQRQQPCDRAATVYTTLSSSPSSFFIVSFESSHYLEMSERLYSLNENVFHANDSTIRQEKTATSIHQNPGLKLNLQTRQQRSSRRRGNVFYLGSLSRNG